MSTTNAITRVLIVDGFKDDQDYWKHRLELFSSSSYLVLQAAQGALGVEFCRAQKVDCVVLELDLPDMSGFEVLVELVPNVHRPQIPVVVLTRLHSQDLLELALKNGAQASLLKSRASGDVLDQAIQRAIAAVRQSNSR